MLVLSRNTGEVTYIINTETGETIEIIMLEVKERGGKGTMRTGKGTVKVGLNGPKKYTFLRKEVADREKIEVPGIITEPMEELLNVPVAEVA